MNFYKSVIMSLLWAPENIVNSFHSETAFAFTWDPVSGATGYEYSTDAGKTVLPIQNGAKVFVDSEGNSIIQNNYYDFTIRAVDDENGEISEWSEKHTVLASPAFAPVAKTLVYHINGKGVYLRGGVVDDGTVDCQMSFEIDGIDIGIWISGLHTGDLCKQFVQLDFSVFHQYRIILKNMAGTVYGDYIIIPPLNFYSYRMMAYNVV